MSASEAGTFLPNANALNATFTPTTNIPPLVQGQIKKLGAEIGKIERELNSRK